MEAEAEAAATGGNESAIERPRTLGLWYYLVLFVRFRWAAAGSAALTIAASQFLLRIESFAFAKLYAIVGMILLYNVAFLAHLESSAGRAPAPDTRDEPRAASRARRLALAMILMDLLALFWLLHFSGGLTNPFVMLFLLHVVVACILLEPRPAVGVALFTSALVTTLGVFEKIGALTRHQPVEILGDIDPLESWLFTLGLPAVMTVTIFSLTLLIIPIMNERGRRRDRIIELGEELDRKNRKLLRLDEMRMQLLAVASHDLKSPISAVSSYLMGMRDGYLGGPLNADQQRAVERSLSRLARLQVFISDMLDWTAVERGIPRQDMREVDLAGILRRSVEDHEEQAGARRIRIDLRLPRNLPPVFCSPGRMAQVFDNLISNAVKYSNDGGAVRIEAGAEDDRVLFVFDDDGIGIGQEDLGRLFQDFYRAPAVKGRFEGTGLGLSLARRIVAAHGGDIRVESELGRGSTFLVRLPVRHEHDDQRLSLFPLL